MDYVDLRLQFEQSLALRLARAENAPLVLAVLFAAFKHEHKPVVSESRLRALLEGELEELRSASHIAVDKSAKQYLSEWSDTEHGYLRRFQPANAEEPAYELTPETERVFQWIESLRPRPHVGTESKFKNLATALADIVENSSCEPDFRIERLRAEQARLQQQIDQILETGVAPIYSATQINERFASVLETARQLLGEFREVERHFRQITEEIVARQADGAVTRGGIVGETLDAQDRLRNSSQGQSFYAFWDFLLASERRQEFASLVERAYAVENLAQDLRSDPLLRTLQYHLRVEGRKVLSSNERLVAQLRRILDVRQSAERKEVGRLIQEIKALAYATRDRSPATELNQIDTTIDLASLMSKSQWTLPVAVSFGGNLDVAHGADYEAALEAFLSLHPIDFAQLREHVRDCLTTRVQVSLPELLEEYPPRNGILEILAYMVIAETDGPHVIFDEFDLIELADSPDRVFRVPRIVFSNT